MIMFFSVLILLGGCKQERTSKETIKTVKTYTVIPYGENKTASFPGKVKASSEVNLAFRISGPITRVMVKEGEHVRKGQILAEMDSRDYEIQYSATEAEYKQVKAEAERIIGLYQKESVAENDHDKAVAGLQQITSKYNAHKNALADTKLRAPFDGYVQKRYFDKDETVSAGIAIFSLISTQSPEVVINIPASDFIQRDKFDTFHCTFDIYPGKVFPLDLISISRKANLNQLYTVRLKINPALGAEMPSPGMATMVTINYQPENEYTVSIPVTAIFQIDGQSHAWVYDNGQQNVSARKINLSEVLSDGTAVISEGLKSGEIIISAGVHSLSDGQKVKPLEEPSKTNVGGLL